MTVTNNVPTQNGGQPSSFLTTLLTPIGYAAQALSYTVDAVGYTAQAVYSQLPSFPYVSQIKNVANTLWDPTPFVVEKVKDKLSNVKVDLTEGIMVKAGEDKSFHFNIVQGLAGTILKKEENKRKTTSIKSEEKKNSSKEGEKSNSLRTLLSRKITSKVDAVKDTVTNTVINKLASTAQDSLRPLPPPMSKKMLDNRAEVLNKKQQELTEQEELMCQEKKILDKIKNVPKRLVNKVASFTLEEEIAQHRQDSLAAQYGAPANKNSWGTGEEIIHTIASTLLGRLCIEKNLGNVINHLFKELTEVITSLQKVDLIGSKSAKSDFIKEFSGNVNINADEFEKKQKSLLRKNLKKIVSNIIKKADAGILGTFASSLLPEKLVDKILERLTELVSSIVDKHLELYQEMLKNGAKHGSVNIQFPKAPNQCLLDQDAFESFKSNIDTLLPFVLYTLITVLVDGLANYIDWDAEAPAQKAMSEKDKAMRNDVNKNFTDLIGAVQSTISNTLSRVMGETLELRHNGLEVSEGIFGFYLLFGAISMVTAFLHIGGGGFAELFLDTTAHGDEDRSKTYLEFIRVIISNIARGAIFGSVKFAGYEAKKIKIAEIIPALADCLGRIAQT